MKTSFTSRLAFLVICIFATGSVFAEPADVYINESECGVIGGTANKVHEVSVNNANGIVHISCSTDVDAPSSGHSEVYNIGNTGFQCSYVIDEENDDVIYTDDWHQVTSASGNAKLVCHFKQ